MKIHTTRRSGAALSVLVAIALAPANAAGANLWQVHFNLENDVVAGEDRHYSNGISFGTLSPEGRVPEWLVAVSRLLPTRGPREEGLRFGLSLHQELYTPEDYNRSDLILDERPYAGWLFLRTGLYRRHLEQPDSPTAHADFLELDLGIVGPAALAKQSQNLIHQAFAAPSFEGWSHQLKNEFGAVVRGGRVWRIPGEVISLGSGLELDLLAGLQAELGNVTTAFAASLRLRAGVRLPRDFGRGRSARTPKAGAPWRLFAFVGFEPKGVAHNIFLDGNTTRSSHSVDRKPFVMEVPAGLACEIGNFRGSFTWILRSREFDGQNGGNAYGRLALAYLY